MKICKYIIGLFALVGLMTSCDKDNVGGIYTPYTQNISFESDEAVDILTSESSAEFTIRLVRNITKGEYTVHYVFDTEDEDIFTDENGGTVTFADGQAVAVISMKASNMEKGVEYTGTLTLSDEDIETADTIIGNPIVITNITVMCDYEWVEAGKCKFTDYTMYEGVPYSAENVTILHADGTNIYRIDKPFMAVYGEGDEGFSTDTGITFELNDDNSVTLITNGGIVASADQFDFVWLDQYVPAYCNSTVNGNTYQFTMLGLVGGEGYYTGFAFEFEWTEGWPGN